MQRLQQLKSVKNSLKVSTLHAFNMEDNPLSRPTLDQVRTHQIGKFFEIIKWHDDLEWHDKTLKEKDKFKTIKSVTHPTWFEDVRNVKQMTLYLSENVYDLLKSDGTVSGRWTNKKPKWISKNKSETGEAHFVFYVRTPKGNSKYVDYETLKRYRTPKSKVGRPPSGFSYKLRREVWRALENPEYTIKLLKNRKMFEKDREKTKSISVRLPDLSLALKELLREFLIPKINSSDYHILDKWVKYRDVNLDLQERDVILEYSSSKDLELLIDIVAERQWKAILTRIVELRVLDKASKGKKSNPDNEINIVECIDVEIDDPTQFSCNECNSFNWEYDHVKNKKYCGNCGIEVEDLFSTEYEVEKRIYENGNS